MKTVAVLCLLAMFCGVLAKGKKGDDHKVTIMFKMHRMFNFFIIYWLTFDLNHLTESKDVIDKGAHLPKSNLFYFTFNSKSPRL